MNKIKITLFALLIALFTVPAHAQFNIKKLGKEIKQGAERQVERKATEKAQETLNEALDGNREKATASEEKVTSGQTEEQVAKQDGEQAGEQPSGQDGSTFSMEDAHKRFYELDDAVYYSARTNDPTFFYDEEDMHSVNMIRIDMLEFMHSRLGGEDQPLIVVSEGNDNIAPCGERAINAYLALFAAYAPGGYYYFAGARSMIDPLVNGEVPLDYTPANIIQARVTRAGDDSHQVGYGLTDYARRFGYGLRDGLFIAPTGMKDGNEPAKRQKRWKDERDRLMKVCYEQVPYQTVARSLAQVVNFIAALTEKEMWAEAAAYSYWADVMAHDFQNHPKKESSDYNNEVWENYRRFADEGFPVYRQFVKEQWDEFYADYSGKVKLTYDMPTAKQNNPQLEAEMLAVARTVYDDGRTALKAIIQSTDWAYDRTALGQIINRNQSAYIIYKMPDGTHRAIELGFKQMYDGGSYGKLQLRGIGTRDFEVEYN